MKFPLIFYMSPEGPKWQPKYFVNPRRLPHPTDHHTRHPEFKGVQFAPRVLVVNATRRHEEIPMYSKVAFMSAYALGATVIACTLFAANVVAEDPEFAVAYRM